MQIARQEAHLGLPDQWRDAFERDRENPLHGNDPLPERQAARFLAAFILTGLVFVLLPGTLLGVWNLLTIAGEHTGSGASAALIQAHGQAQLLGWVGTFILGISLYVLPKISGRSIARPDLVWLDWALWTAGVAWRWWIGVSGNHWQLGLVASAALELAAFMLAQYLLWIDRPAKGAVLEQPQRQKPFPGDLASWLGVVGFGSFIVALALNFGIAIDVARHAAEPVYPPIADRIFLILALWGFAIPIAWSYSTRFVTIFAGLAKPKQSAARWLAAGVAVGVLCALLRQFLAASVLAAVVSIGAIWALRVFERSEHSPKRLAVYRHYPAFMRLAYLWLLVGAFLGIAAELSPQINGLGGASRHALTVGFLATLIFCVAPLILPSFLAGRELQSSALMGASLWLLTAGCTLRVSSESLAYSSPSGASWRILPISALLELTAVFFFVVNIGLTMAQRIPAWFGPSGIAPQMPVYFYVASFPKAKRVLQDAGLTTLASARKIPRTLTLAEAAVADHADLDRVLGALRDFFADRRPRRQQKN
jgi:uncharacterized protein involved in response to NO